MKKIVTIVLSMALCISLTACGGEETEQTSPTNQTVPTLTDMNQTEPVLTEQVIYDADGIRVTVKGMEENTMTGTNIRILLENGTDRNIVFSGDLFVVNDVTVPGYLYAEAAAGTRKNDAIEFYTDALNASGIAYIGEIRGFDTRIVDTDTYETLAEVPLELITAYAREGSYAHDESGVKLYDDQGILVTAQMISTEFYGRTARLLVKNETEKDIIVEAENISVNGYTVDAWLYDTVVADTVRYCQLDLFQSGLEENGIDQIETISFRLNFLDAASFDTIAQSEVLTVDVMG